MPEVDFNELSRSPAKYEDMVSVVFVSALERFRPRGRLVIREVPGAAEAAAAVCSAHDCRDPGKPKIAWDDQEARAALVSALVNDALGLLGRLPAQPEGPAADAAGLLALVAGQDVEPTEGSDGTDGRWRIARRTAPGRVVSVTDPDARHVHKNRARHQDGFKAHVSFEPETGLLTADGRQRGRQPRRRGRGPPAGRRAGEGDRAGRCRLRHRRAARSPAR